MAVDLELARKRFKFADDAEHNQRAREREDLGFYEGESQWPEEIKALRAGQQSNGNFPAVPARPCLTINKVRDPIRRIQNDELQADLGMSITAADDFGGEIDDSEIELREGLARRIQRQSNAKDARMWAANRAAISGRGWYGISTQWVDADSFDQEIIYERFYDQFSVLADPAHEQPDGSDIEYAFVGRDVPWDIYREEYPALANGRRNPLANASVTDAKWRAFADEAPGWLSEDGDARMVRVTRYWRYERERYEIVLMDDGSVMPAEDLPDDALDAIPPERKRERVVKRVKSALIDGVNVLEETDWPGKYIPLIKIVGEEIHVFDKERRYEGLVRPARDPQKSFNAMVSTAVETISLAPKSPWLVPVGAIENFESMWRDAAVRNWPYLPFNDRDPATQQPITPPQRNQAEPPIQAMAQMIGAFDQAIMATIGQANLADTHPDVRSGQMASKLIDEAARGTSNYLANLIRSVHYEGAIVNDLLYPIYGIRKGRIVSMMNGQQKTERVMIGQPFVQPQGSGMPQAHDPMNPQQQGMKPKQYTLTKDGSFTVAIQATKYYETKQEETLSLMAGLIDKQPEMMLQTMGDRFFELVGDEDLAKRFRTLLAPPIQELLRSGQPPDPRLQEAQELLKGLHMEMQQLKADKHARIEQAAIKAQSDAATSQMDNETKERIAQANNATQILIAEMKSAIQEQGEQVKMLVAADKARQEEMRTIEAFMEEKRLATDRDHEIGMQHLKHQHNVNELEEEARVFPPSTNGSGE